MTGPVDEFILGESVADADAHARAIGWRASGRASWLTPEGVAVHFIFSAVQIEGLPPGATVHLLNAPAESSRLLERRARIVRVKRKIGEGIPRRLKS